MQKPSPQPSPTHFFHLLVCFQGTSLKPVCSDCAKAVDTSLVHFYSSPMQVNQLSWYSLKFWYGATMDATRRTILLLAPSSGIPLTGWMLPVWNSKWYAISLDSHSKYTLYPHLWGLLRLYCFKWLFPDSHNSLPSHKTWKNPKKYMNK